MQFCRQQTQTQTIFIQDSAQDNCYQKRAQESVNITTDDQCSLCSKA